MDLERAKAILESHGVIEVFYQEQPVWIENLNPDETAQVSFLTQEKTAAIPIASLTEHP